MKVPGADRTLPILSMVALAGLLAIAGCSSEYGSTGSAQNGANDQEQSSSTRSHSPSATPMGSYGSGGYGMGGY